MAFRGLPQHLRVDGHVASIRQLSLFGCRARTFAPYEQWEDYRAGMFGGRSSEAYVLAACGVLGVEAACLSAMRRIISEWPVITAVNFSNSGLNHRAWIGQAACCLAVGATATETKRAWWQLTERQRRRANRCADVIIAEWQLNA